jgi:hypothetical protein
MDRDTNDLLCFKVICNFVKDLTSGFENNHPLQLYNRLLEKTPISNSKIIRKHVSIFEDYIKLNKEGILGNDFDKLVSDKIIYNETVLIQIKKFLKDTDNDTKNQIFKHLQYIGSLCIEEEITTFKKSLKSTALQLSESSSSEEQFIGNLINKVENTIDVNKIDNPMTAVTQLLSSGVLNDVIGTLQNGLSNGNLDIGKLLGAMQGISGGQDKGGPSQIPDLSGIMNMLPGLLGGLNMQSSNK